MIVCCGKSAVWIRVALPLGLVLLLIHPSAQAQAAAESAMMTSQSAVSASAAKPASLPQATPAQNANSPHLPAPVGPPAEEINRRSFEDNAGEKAARLLLRSVPNGAEIFINNLSVGRTPLLMLVAPGKYEIAMRGPRQESGRNTVGVMAKETQTVVINLNQRYPTSIRIP